MARLDKKPVGRVAGPDGKSQAAIHSKRSGTGATDWLVVFAVPDAQWKPHQTQAGVQTVPPFRVTLAERFVIR